MLRAQPLGSCTVLYLEECATEHSHTRNGWDMGEARQLAGDERSSVRTRAHGEAARDRRDIRSLH